MARNLETIRMSFCKFVGKNWCVVKTGISGSRTRQSAGDRHTGHYFPRSGVRGYQNIWL